jgi:hypothetical protein
LDEKSLVVFVKSLLTLSQQSYIVGASTRKRKQSASLDSQPLQSSSPPTASNSITVTTVTASATTINNLYNAIEDILGCSVRVSSPSCAWLEMLAVDAALRNRERIGVLWQMLEQHYLLTLAGATSLSYTNER